MVHYQKKGRGGEERGGGSSVMRFQRKRSETLTWGKRKDEVLTLNQCPQSVLPENESHVPPPELNTFEGVQHLNVRETPSLIQKVNELRVRTLQL